MVHEVLNANAKKAVKTAATVVYFIKPGRWHSRSDTDAHPQDI